jgi:hypothetical protein
MFWRLLALALDPRRLRPCLADQRVQLPTDLSCPVDVPEALKPRTLASCMGPSGIKEAWCST